MKETSANVTWAKYGLSAPKFLRRGKPDSRFASLPQSRRFRLALEEMGGLYTSFGRFLDGRSDLLAASLAEEFRTVKSVPAERVPTEILKILEPAKPAEVVPVQRGVSSSLYRASYQGQPVVLEVFEPERPDFEEKAWVKFSSGLRSLRDDFEAGLTAGSVLDEFRQWLELQVDVERKRTILRNLQNLPSGCISSFPALVPELQSERVLAYEYLEGRPVESDLAGSPDERQKTLQRVLEAFLEQSLFLSVVSTEIDIASMAALDGRIAVRYVPALAPLPPASGSDLLHYLCAAIAGDSARAVWMLSRILQRADGADIEGRLWRNLAALRPDLKLEPVRLDSLSSLREYWRAATATGAPVPLSLHLFHRQALYLGHLNAQHAPGADLLSESIWAVLGRVLRFRMGEQLSLGKAQEWLLGSGLLFFGASRQLASILEQMRENDFSLRVETQRERSGGQASYRRTLSILASVISLTGLLLALRAAFAETSTPQMVAAAVALVAGAALIFFSARIN